MISHSRRPAPAPSRTSRNTSPGMRAIRLGPAFVDLVVHPRELTREPNSAFERKFLGAMADNPQVLVINLTASSNLDEEGLSILRAAHARASERGVRMHVRPSSSAGWAHLEGLGLTRVAA